MKFLHLIWRNALRNRLRTGLTVAGIGFLLFVLVFVRTALTEIEAWEGEAATHFRVVVQHSTGLATPLPIQLENYLKGDEIARHASVVQKLNWCGCYYQDPKNMFANFAVDHETLVELWDELTIDPEGYRKLRESKTATLVGEELMKQFGWKVGQKITLIGTFYPIHPELEIVGTFRARNVRQEVQLFFRWDYFDELMGGRKIVGTYWIKARAAEDVPKLKELIDGHTKNSSDPTETLTEKEFAVQFMEMMGNVKGIVAGVSAIIVVIMVLMTANTMAMSARERVTEVALLRTLGFTAGRIVFVVVAESVLVSLLAVAAPFALSLTLFNVLGFSPSPLYFPIFRPVASTYGVALGVAVFCGLASAAVPAVRSARRKIVDGLRQVV
jgi:putative ABC transport system permease protein